MFAFARSEKFLRDQLEEFRRSRPGRPCADPVRTLEEAFRLASELDRVPEMTAFTLAWARWASRREAWTPLAALRAGHEQLASDLAARGAAGAVKALLPDCAQEAESAYAACLALARATPSQADAIASEVAAS